MFYNKFRMYCAVLAVSSAISACAPSSSNKLDANSIELVLESSQQRAPLLPTSVFFNESSMSDLQLSNDGNWLAWLQNHNGIQNIFVMPVDGMAEDAYPLTTLSEPVDQFFWHSQTTDIFYSQDAGGNENQQIYRLKTQLNDKLVLKQITRLTHKDDTNYMVAGQVEDNANQLIILANHDDKARMDFYQLNVESGSLSPTLVNDMSFMSFLTKDNGDIKVAVKMHSDSSYELFSNNKGKWQGLLRSAPGEIIQLTDYNEKKDVAYISTSLGDLDKLSLLSVNLLDGTVNLAHEDPKARSDVYDSMFDDDGNLLMVSYYYGHKENYFLDQSMQNHWLNIQSKFDRQIEIELLERNQENGKWLLSLALE